MSSFTGRDNSFLTTEISNDGFWPDLSLGELQRIYRVPTSSPVETITHQLTLAMVDVNRQLNDLKIHWQKSGFTTLSEVEDSPLYAPQKPTTLYKTAVFMWCKAELLEDFETFTRRDIASNIAEQKPEVFAECKANARRAINLLLGRNASLSVELL